ncbi:MAG: MarR family winged helix-turn-helix transcriptional regulator [Candidatus Dormibacteraceae bacterium]
MAATTQTRRRSAIVTPRLEDLEQEAWEGLLRTHERLWRALEAGLAQLDVSMAEYSVLALLGSAGARGMRMSDLAERRLMSTGGFTRLADRLERRGLIERRRSTSDGRSFNAILTTEGRALLRRSWRRHHSDLRALFFNRLDDKSLHCLADIWARLNPSVATDDGDTPGQIPTPRDESPPDPVQ